MSARIAMLCALAALAACGDDGPEPLPPLTTVSIHAGDGQQGVAGSAVATPPSVIVTDRAGNAMSGVSITFSVSGGGGSIAGATTTTDASGIATVGGWTLGKVAGANALTATADVTDVPAIIHATGVAGPAAQLAFNAGSTTGIVGTAVSFPPSVIAMDANGNPVSGVPVTFAVTAGGGSQTGAMQTTNAGGVATVGSWTLGTLAGENRMSATAAGLTGSPVAIEATGLAAGPATIVLYGGSVIGSPSTALATPPSVLVRDANGNAVPDVSVTFAVTAGGGSITGGTQTTDAGGIARVGAWTLGSAVGVNTLTATVTGLAPLTLTADMFGSLYGTCALSTAGRAHCWGYNVSGQVGDGSKVDRTTPVPVIGGLTFVSLANGDAMNCGLTNLGAAYCWGYNESGELGDGTTMPRLGPVAVSGGHTFSTLSGGDPMCGVNSVGPAFCWGRNDWGSLGDGTFDPMTGMGPAYSATPVAVAGNLLFASLGTSVLDVKCGLTTAGAAHCWGYGGQGQLGNGGTMASNVPVPVSGALQFTELAPGQTASCGLAGGLAYCWGYNQWGSVGDGTVVDRLVPTPVFGSQSFAHIVTGGTHTCALTSAGAAYCWGHNQHGQLGIGSTTDRHLPTAVTGGKVFASLSAHADGTCGMTAAREIYCWGEGDHGANGDGTKVDRTSPVRVTPTTLAPATLAVAAQTVSPNVAGSWTESLVVTNTGNLPTGPVRVSIAGANAADFMILSTSCTGTSLAPGATCTVTMNFSGSGASGPKSALLSVTAVPGGTASTALGGVKP